MIVENDIYVRRFIGTWHIFGQRKDVSFDELVDVGRAVCGARPVKHEWVMISKDRSAYCLGPIVDDNRETIRRLGITPNFGGPYEKRS